MCVVGVDLRWWSCLVSPCHAHSPSTPCTRPPSSKQKHNSLWQGTSHESSNVSTDKWLVLSATNFK